MDGVTISWLNRLTESTDIDIKTAEKCVKYFYKICGFSPAVEVFVADSPKHAQEIASDKMAFPRSNLLKLHILTKICSRKDIRGMQLPSPYKDAAREFPDLHLDVLYGIHAKFPFGESLSSNYRDAIYIEQLTHTGAINNTDMEYFLNYLRSGVFGSIFFTDKAILIRRPKYIKFNDRGALHSSDSPAVGWENGDGAYFLNGIRVGEPIVMTPPESMNAELILRLQNVEIRREVVRKMGIERVIQQLGGQEIDRWDKDKNVTYRLVILDIPDMRVVPTYLIMKNPSLGVWHAEGVPPECTTVREALAWRDEDPEEYIVPEQLT